MKTIKSKKILIFVVVLVLGALIFFFPKPYDHAGGFKGELLKNDRTCFGISKLHAPRCADCYETLYCFGIPYRNS